MASYKLNIQWTQVYEAEDTRCIPNSGREFVIFGQNVCNFSANSHFLFKISGKIAHPHSFPSTSIVPTLVMTLALNNLHPIPWIHIEFNWTLSFNVLRKGMHLRFSCGKKRYHEYINNFKLTGKRNLPNLNKGTLTSYYFFKSPFNWMPKGKYQLPRRGSAPPVP